MDTGVVATIIPDGEVRGLPYDTLQSGTAFTTTVFLFHADLLPHTVQSTLIEFHFYFNPSHITHE